jgi:hypothetical protein
MSLRERTAARTPKGSRARAGSERELKMAEVRGVLRSLENGLWAGDWKGRTGLTDRSVYLALIGLGWRHGKLIPSGVRISVAIRQLALEAGVSKPTVCAAVKRLTLEHELIRRDGRGEGPKCGAFVLLADPRSTYPLVYEYHRRTGVYFDVLECTNPERVPLRWGPGRLGKVKEFLLDALRRLGEATELELAVAMGRQRRARDLRCHLDALVDLGVVQRRGDWYALHKDAFQRLWIERENSGEIEAEERDRRAYKEESKSFKKAWARGEVRRRPDPIPIQDETA